MRAKSPNAAGILQHGRDEGNAVAEAGYQRESDLSVVEAGWVHFTEISGSLLVCPDSILKLAIKSGRSD